MGVYLVYYPLSVFELSTSYLKVSFETHQPFGHFQRCKIDSSKPVAVLGLKANWPPSGKTFG